MKESSPYRRLYDKAMMKIIMLSHQNDWSATRSSLLSRVKDWNDQESWRDFFDIYSKRIYHVALKAGLNAAEAQDVVQEVLVTVAKSIRDGKYDRAKGPFKGWLMNTTRWRINDAFGKRLPLSESSPNRYPEDTSTVDGIPAPDSQDVAGLCEKGLQMTLRETALLRIKGKVGLLQYQIFDLYVEKGCAVAKIKDTLGVSATQVYLAKHRISRLLEKEIKRLEKGHF